MKKCGGCGKMVNERLSQCPKCGAEFSTVAPPLQPASPPEVRRPIAERGAEALEPAAGGLAGFWIRLGAHIIDGVLVSLVAIPFAGLGFFTAFSQISQGIEPDASVGAFSALGNVLSLLAWIANNIVLQGVRGWSLGKRLCGITVCGEDGFPIGIGRNVGRELFKAIISPCICLLGYFWMLWDDYNQTWHDKVVGSYVRYM